MLENAEISFYAIATSLNTASQIALAPITGVISRITISWPSGCNFLVPVLFRVKRRQFVPEPTTGGESGIRLNNYTEQIAPNYSVTINDPIEMYIENHDSANDHAISALMHIDSVDTGAGEPLHAKGSKGY
jgi:hypothetical protein